MTLKWESIQEIEREADAELFILYGSNYYQRLHHLEAFSISTHFDYIVIDETHRAAAGFLSRES